MLFRQGLLLAYGFNTGEARRNFLAAAAAAGGWGMLGSGECAVCLWGVAYSLTPNINYWAGAYTRPLFSST